MKKHPSAPTVVGEDVFFQVPEMEQLPAGAYKHVGQGRVDRKGASPKFYIFRRLGNYEKCVVGYTPSVIEPNEVVTLIQSSSVPPISNYEMRAVRFEELPAHSYKLVGVGRVHLRADEGQPVGIYILERDDGFLVATRISIPRIVSGTVVDVVRSKAGLRIGVIRAEELTEKLEPAKHSVYAWVDGMMHLVRHIPPDRSEKNE